MNCLRSVALAADAGHECRVFSGLRRPFDVGPVEWHAVQHAACHSRVAEKRASDADENTLHSSPTAKDEPSVRFSGLPDVQPAPLFVLVGSWLVGNVHQ